MAKEKNSLLTKGNIGTGTKIYNIIIFVVLLIFSISLLYPLFWAIINSFKNIIEYTLDPIGFPTQWAVDNYSTTYQMLYIEIFKEGIGLVRYGVSHMLEYTLLLALIKPFLSTFWTFAAAYAIGRCKVVGGRFLYNLGVVVMIIPIVGTFGAQMMVYRQLGWYDNLFANIAITSGAFSGMNFMMLYAAMKGIPWDYTDAAYVDGAGQARIMFEIIFPMVSSTCLVFYFLGFLGAWNDYNTSMIWLPSFPTIAYGMYIFQYSASRDKATMPQVLAGFIMLMIPTVALYLSIHNLILEKIQIGGLKG